MNFTQPSFFLFCAFVFVLFYLPGLARFQLQILLVASLVFYAFDQPNLLILLVFSAAVSTASSYQVLRVSSTGRRRMWAAGGVVVNLSILALFKYSGLISETLGVSDGGLGHFLLTLPLPIGISFYTFHGISLMVDVFRRGSVSGSDMAAADQDFTSHLQRTFLYLTFFPQLIAGPIVKAHDFYPQMRPKQLRDVNWEGAIRCLVIGYFLKVVVADNMADQTFWMQYPYFLALSSLNLLVLLFGYSVQIFADFAGYSLIAIGLGRLFGYELPQNFRFPYIAQTFSEFWTRWHISLSSWLREYLYIPLGGNRRGRARTYANLLIVMFLGGLWHGAAWSYAAWGLWHGGALALERMAAGSRFYRSTAPVVAAIRMGLVFTVVTVGWLLFKLPEFSEVLAYLRAIGQNWSVPFSTGVPAVIFAYSLPVILYHALALVRLRGGSARSSSVARVPEMLAFGVLLAAIFLQPGEQRAFIYFQF